MSPTSYQTALLRDMKLCCDLRVFLAPGRRRIVARAARRVVRPVLLALGDTACENSPQDCFCFANPTSAERLCSATPFLRQPYYYIQSRRENQPFLCGKPFFVKIYRKGSADNSRFVLLFGENAQNPARSGGVMPRDGCRECRGRLSAEKANV